MRWLKFIESKSKLLQFLFISFTRPDMPVAGGCLTGVGGGVHVPRGQGRTGVTHFTPPGGWCGVQLQYLGRRARAWNIPPGARPSTNQRAAISTGFSATHHRSIIKHSTHFGWYFSVKWTLPEWNESVLYQLKNFYFDQFKTQYGFT